jgi:hypothetical protein
MDLPIPDDFYYDPENITRQFNTLVNMGIEPKRIDPKLTPENVYKGSLEYDEPDSGGFGSFVTGIIVPALSIAYPGIGPILQGLSAAYQISKGDVLGGLTSGIGALSGTQFFKNTFGDLGAFNITNNISSALKTSFGLSDELATNLANAGVYAGGNAIMAALSDQDVLMALAEGAGEGYLRNAIDSSMADTIPDRRVRNFISTNISNNLLTVLKGGEIDLSALAGSAIGNTVGSLAFSDMYNKRKAANP